MKLNRSPFLFMLPSWKFRFRRWLHDNDVLLVIGLVAALYTIGVVMLQACWQVF